MTTSHRNHTKKRFSSWHQVFDRRSSLRLAFAFVAFALATEVAQSAPIISDLSPTRQVLDLGQSLNLSVAATGSGTLGYQWLHNGVAISGATASSLAIASTGPLDAGWYFVDVTDTAGTTRSPSIFVSFSSGQVSISAGGSHNLFLIGGALTGVGNNQYGQLGDGTTIARDSPVQIALGVITASAGTYHSLFIKSDGSLWATGGNYSGQLGDGSTTARHTPVQVASDAVAVTCGDAHSLFIKSDGTLWAMGENGYGELGDGTTTSRSTPVQIATNVVAASAGLYHSLFIKSDGTLWAMGMNFSGQVGDGTTTFRTSPVQVATDAVAIAGGGNHSLFIKSDGTLWGMGDNYYGQLGDGTTNGRLSPEQIAIGVTAVAAGASHSLYIKLDGTLWAMGENLTGELGDGTPSIRIITPEQIDSGIASVAAGVDHSMYVKGDGTVWAMGTGAVGDGTDLYLRTSPVPLYLVPVIVVQPVNLTVIAGNNTTFTVTVKGSPAPTYQWRKNGANIIGATSSSLTFTGVAPGDAGSYDVVVTNCSGSATSTTAALTVNPPASDVAPQTAPPPAVAVTAGMNSTMFITADGTLWGAGDNTYGQLGNEPKGQCLFPQPIATGVVSAAGGLKHSVFLKSDGTLWTMGNNGSGQFGLGGISDPYSGITNPLKLASGVASVAAGANFTLYIKSDGSLWGMGDNSSGQLGSADGRLPALLASGVAAVAPGYTHTMFIKSDGTLWAMGDNTYGQLGDGTTTSRFAPVQVASNVASVAAGQFHSVFVKTDGTLWATGGNWSGQLGDTTTVSRYTPYQVASGVSSVAAGAGFTVFVKTDGTLWATGDNSWGQLGDGDMGYLAWRDNPLQVEVSGQPVTGVTAVACGGAHTVFLKQDGSLWAVGANDLGQLGDYGAEYNLSNPVKMTWLIKNQITTSRGSSTFTVTNSLTPTPVVVDPALVVASVSHTLSSARITFTGVFNSFFPEDLLAFTNDGRTMGNISGSYDRGYGILTLVSSDATATQGQWQSALRSITYANSLKSPNTANRAISFTINDGSVNSIPATKYVSVVNNGPVITTQPVSQTANVGATVTFTVVATGIPTPTYQWQKGWVDIPGANGASYTIPHVSLTDTDTYTVVVTNPIGSVTSDWATLSVNPATAPDFNGDGQTDFVWENTVTGEHGIWLMNGSAVTNWAGLPTVPADWHVVGAADFNGDRQTDIVWENAATGEHGLWLMNGSAVASWAGLPTEPTDWHIAGTGDFNGDRQIDIVWENVVTGERGIWLMNGSTVINWASLPSEPVDWHIVGAADFNSDGQTDIVWENSATGEHGIWLMNGSTVFNWASLPTEPTDWHVVGMGDFNGDGQVDIVWENTATGERGVWLMNGSAVINWATLPTEPTDWHIAR
jgi:alpha-tubulin suppressor-like RCC1 family protein